MYSNNSKSKKLIVFCLLITLILSISQLDTLRVQNPTQSQPKNIQIQHQTKFEDLTIYERHFSHLFGKLTFQTLIKQNPSHVGMIKQLQKLRKYNIFESTRILKLHFSQYMEKLNLILSDNQILANSVPFELLTIFQSIYETQKKILNQILADKRSQQLQNSLQKLTVIKRAMQFISRQLSTQGDLRQVIYRKKQLQDSKWVVERVRSAIEDNTRLKDLLNEDFISEFSYTEEPIQQKTRYFDIDGNEIH